MQRVTSESTSRTTRSLAVKGCSRDVIPTRSKGKGPGDRVAADPHEVDGLTLLRLLSGDWIHVIFGKTP